jgi:GNAT superfamily N-acetyltransferase
MTDLLVKLYELSDTKPEIDSLSAIKIHVHRALAAEKNIVVGWTQKQFGDGWSAECELSFSLNPIGCMIAVSEGKLVGFACHDCTCKNFFGPIGIDPAFRKKGVGRALLKSSLEAMAQAGFAYAIIGDSGATEFFEKCVGAIPIPGSTPGIYRTPDKQIR